MNIYDAIMKAADRIETHPKSFDFYSCDMPHPCGTPGCAIGWIAYYAGAKSMAYFVSTQFPDGHFYVAMDSLVGESPRDQVGERVTWGPWTKDAKLCALGMRLFAEKHHAPRPVVVPDWHAMAATQAVFTDARYQELVS